MLPELRELYRRDLQRLMAELEVYSDDAAVWRLQGDILNSAGTLALHLTGNLRQFIGLDLGGVPYTRDREAEFSRRDVPRAELLDGLREVQATVDQVLADLPAERLSQPASYTLPNSAPLSTGAFLMHLYGHLNWHLGQINYHRRLTDLRA